MNFREATTGDIRNMFSVRMSVRENVLNTPALVTDEIVEEYITKRGKGWLCEIDGYVVGFAIADLKDESIWALFVRPEYEGKGIGKQLHTIMMNWYFGKGKEKAWLGTSPNTRAEVFYLRNGWKNTGKNSDNELKFEMTATEWMK